MRSSTNSKTTTPRYGDDLPIGFELLVDEFADLIQDDPSNVQVARAFAAEFGVANELGATTLSLPSAN